MNTNRKIDSVAHLTRLLDDPDNLSTEFVHYLRRLARTGDPDAAPVIARFLDMPGVVGRCAARSLVRLSRSSPECLGDVLQICQLQVRTAIDADVIRNARRVCRVIARRVPVLRKAA